MQKPDIANPPTLFLAVESLVARTLEHASSATTEVAADGSVAQDPEVALTLQFVKYGARHVSAHVCAGP